MSDNGYDFYLKNCLLPVTPGKLQLKINGANSRVTLINEGEINVLKAPKLTDIEFECLIPQVEYPSALRKSGFKDAAYYLNFFEKLKVDKKPFQFIVSRNLPDGKPLFSTNIKVSMEDYTITEQTKEGFDLTVKIKLKQYRDFGTKTVNIAYADSSSSGKAAVKVETARAASTVREEVPIVIGSDVIVNGRLHGNSYGDAPGQTKTNYRGKVNFINMKGSHPYHVTTPDGGWLGWVTKESVKGV